jgi:starvation-inducible DNA-binding protein
MIRKKQITGQGKHGIVKMALADDLKVVLADTFSFYLKAHNYHWNVEGPNFSDYHAFLLTLYADAWAAVDLVAEHIRTLDVYVPGSYSRFKELSTIEEELKIPNAMTMLSRLEADNKKVLASLMAAHASAESDNKKGIVNFLEDRIDIHEKHGWMLRALTKGK